MEAVYRFVPLPVAAQVFIFQDQRGSLKTTIRHPEADLVKVRNSHAAHELVFF